MSHIIIRPLYDILQDYGLDLTRAFSVSVGKSREV